MKAHGVPARDHLAHVGDLAEARVKQAALGIPATLLHRKWQQIVGIKSDKLLIPKRFQNETNCGIIHDEGQLRQMS